MLPTDRDMDVPLVEIDQVLKTSKSFAGCSIDAPVPGGQSDVWSMDVAGWLLHWSEPITSVEFVHNGLRLKSVAADSPRPDVAPHFPSNPRSGTCGFYGRLGLVGLPPRFEIQLKATFADGRSVPFGTILGRHTRLSTTYRPNLTPIAVTRLGRTGSTLVMRLLSQHPAVIVPAIHPYEVRAATYWLHAVRVLSDPANHAESAHPNTYQETIFAVGNNPHNMEPLIESESVRRWFGCSYVSELAAFAQKMIDQFYMSLDANTANAGRFFAEKQDLSFGRWLLLELYPRARELILVRDFRDMACSMLGFYRKRSVVSFGRDMVDSDVAFIDNLAPAIDRFRQAWQERSEKALLLRYEDLIDSPASSLSRILAYLDIAEDSVTVERMVASALHDDPATRQHRTSASNEKSIGRWRVDMTDDMKYAANRVFGTALKEFGYDPTA